MQKIKKFDYKKLRLSDNYQYSSEEEQEKQDEKTNNLNEFNEQIIKKEADIGKELFKTILAFEDLVICSSFCAQQKIKQKTMN